MGVGAVFGALVVASRAHAAARLVFVTGMAFGVAMCVASFAPTIALFVALLLVVGAAQITFLATCQSHRAARSRAVEARPRDGRLHDHHARQHADRRADRGLDQRGVRAPMGLRHRRHRHPRRCAGLRHRVRRAPDAATRRPKCPWFPTSSCWGSTASRSRRRSGEAGAGQVLEPAGAQLGARGDRVGVAEERGVGEVGGPAGAVDDPPRRLERDAVGVGEVDRPDEAVVDDRGDLATRPPAAACAASRARARRGRRRRCGRAGWRGRSGRRPAWRRSRRPSPRRRPRCCRGPSRRSSGASVRPSSSRRGACRARPRRSARSRPCRA